MPHFSVLIKREAGNDPLTGAFLKEAHEELKIDAHTEDEAFRKSMLLSKLKFIGQIRRTFIDGQEYFDPRV